MKTPERSTPSVATTAVLTAVVLLAFAGNSLLARAALVEGGIGAVEFTAARLLSGAFVLLPFLRGSALALRASLPSALALVVYALAFSLAYLELAAGTGALLLFGAVQVTMIAVGLRGGERPRPARVVGFAIAVAGLAWLVSPGVGAPTPWAAAAMALSGVAWGAYSLRGRGVPNATLATARNFIVAVPIALLTLALFGSGRWSAAGMGLAFASGAGTSGLGYVLWYAALRGHSAISAAIVQLLVPALAALGGVALLDESLDLRLVGSGLLTLGGVALAILAGRRAR